MPHSLAATIQTINNGLLHPNSFCNNLIINHLHDNHIHLIHWVLSSAKVVNSNVRYGRCVETTILFLAPLQIEPIRQLGLDGAVAREAVDGVVVVNIDQEKVGDGSKTPLQARVDVEVFKLTVILQKGCQKNRL
jgi:hypothetical protein